MSHFGGVGKRDGCWLIRKDEDGLLIHLPWGVYLCEILLDLQDKEGRSYFSEKKIVLPLGCFKPAAPPLSDLIHGLV